MKIKNVLAVGGGVMGSQASFYYALNGFDVVQYDISEESLDTCRKYHSQFVDGYRAARPSVTDEEVQAGLARIRYSSDLAEAAQEADLVTESAPESLEIKRQVWADLNRYCPEHTVFTTNTSTLPPSTYADATGRPGKFLALHYGNPIWDTRIAEVMKHPGTEDSAFLQVVEFVESAHLVPIKLEKEQPGYVINTLLVPWLFGALDLVVNDICSYQDVDRTWMLCSQGMSRGPIGVMDVVGFEVLRNVYRLKAAADLGNLQYQKNIDYLEENFINKGYLGVLSGQGFYSYPDPEYARPDFFDN
jgi:3-hydroxybutyryl-CoA dehydrogenase